MAVLTVGAAVGVVDPFYAPPAATPADVSDTPQQVAQDALTATAHGDYRVDWTVPCGDRDWQRRGGNCVFQRYYVDHSARAFVADKGEPYGASGPNIYADEAGYAAYDDATGEHVASRAELLWDNHVFDKESVAETIVDLNATVTKSRPFENGTVVLSIESDRLAYGVATNSLPDPKEPPRDFHGNVTLVVSDAGWLRRFTYTAHNPAANRTATTTDYYDHWGNTTVERPEGARRAPLAWVRDALNWEYRP